MDTAYFYECSTSTTNQKSSATRHCSVNNDVEVKDNGVSRLVIPILCIYDIGFLSPMLVQSIVTPASARTKAEWFGSHDVTFWPTWCRSNGEDCEVTAEVRAMLHCLCAFAAIRIAQLDKWHLGCCRLTGISEFPERLGRFTNDFYDSWFWWLQLASEAHKIVLGIHILPSRTCSFCLSWSLAQIIPRPGLG